MTKPKYYRLTGFGFYSDGEAWIKIAYLPPVIAGGLQEWKISMVISPNGKYYHTHTYKQSAYSERDQWPAKLDDVLENIQLSTGAYGQLRRSKRFDYEQACVRCCEANQWTNGDISQVWGKPGQ